MVIRWGYQGDADDVPSPLRKKLMEHSQAYDLLLLDIELTGGNGVELAAFLREKQLEPSIIYVTAHSDFALDWELKKEPAV